MGNGVFCSHHLGCCTCRHAYEPFQPVNHQNLLACGQDDSADEIFVDLLECGMSPNQLLDSFVYPAHLDVFAILVRLTFIKASG